MPPHSPEAVVIGVSAGGVRALKTILPALPAAFPLPLAIVQHRDERSDAYLAQYLDTLSAIGVKEAEDKELLRPGTAYLAPAGYHLLIEPDRSFGLSVDPRVNYACPSIDVLFESAADAYENGLIGIVLTGANADGSKGLRKIKSRGGWAVVQDPDSAESRVMPRAALEATAVDYIARLEEIAALLIALSGIREGGEHGPSACA